MWHLDAGGWEPSTASRTDIRVLSQQRKSPYRGRKVAERRLAAILSAGADSVGPITARRGLEPNATVAGVGGRHGGVRADQLFKIASALRKSAVSCPSENQS